MKPYHSSDLQIMTNAKYEPKSAKSENKYMYALLRDACFVCTVSMLSCSDADTKLYEI